MSKMQATGRTGVSKPNIAPRVCGTAYPDVLIQPDKSSHKTAAKAPAGGRRPHIVSGDAARDRVNLTLSALPAQRARRRQRRACVCRKPKRLVTLVALMLAASPGMPTSAQAANAPGSLISAQPMPGAPPAATAFQIAYNSTGLNNEPISVSGIVIVPLGPPPPGGRPVVAWAHPTTGIIARCAPSLARVFFASVQGLSGMLARGYVVAATDYPVVGTAELQPYLVGVARS